MKKIKYIILYLASSGSDFLTSSGSGSTSQKVTVPTVPIPATVPQRCQLQWFRNLYSYSTVPCITYEKVLRAPNSKFPTEPTVRHQKQSASHTVGVLSSKTMLELRYLLQILET
jgi:hypothetical protein